MGAVKRYYWIKMPTTYFNNLAQKKMRKEPQGELYQIIYLKLLLLSCDSEGFIYYQGVYDTLCEEIAETINENIDVVESAIDYFKNNKLLQFQDQDLMLPQAKDMIGSEGDSAERVRKYRENKKMLHCNNGVTSCNTEGEKEGDIDKDIEGEGGEKDKECNPPSHLVLFGDFKRVELSETDYNKLCNKYTPKIVNQYIEKADRVGENRGKNIDNGFIYLSNMIEKDYSPQSLDHEKEKEKRKAKFELLEKKYFK